LFFPVTQDDASCAVILCEIRVEFHHPPHFCHTNANDQGPIRNRGIQCVRRTCRLKFSAFTDNLQIGQRTCLPGLPSARHMRNCTSNRSFFISTEGPGLPPSAILALPALTSLRFGFELEPFPAPPRTAGPAAGALEAVCFL